LADDFILVERAGPVGIITLNRPKVHNAINSPMLEAFHRALVEYDRDDGVKAVVLTGAGERAFSSGADIHEQATPAQPRSPLWQTWIWYLTTYRKPTIGAFNGLVYGGAAQLALTLDVRIGCERTSFRFLYASVGRIVGTWILPHVVGWSRAKELLLTARVVGADEAFRIGLLHHQVPSEELLAKAIESGELIAKNHVGSVQGIKVLLNEQIGMGLEEMYRNEQEARETRFPPLSVDEGFRDFLSRKVMSDE
jgi:enoyl-CoA hydratase/carnithine racemase